MEFPGGGGWQPAAPLTRQGSVYSLTFDEFQGTVGREFGSMNMDELLRNIWNAEESHSLAASSAANTISSAAAATSAVAPLQHQGSFSLPRTLSQKTVDEVWRTVMSFDTTATTSATRVTEVAPPALGPTDFTTRRQPTLGEMTLEEFLVRAGVVGEDIPYTQPQTPPPPPPPPPQQQQRMGPEYTTGLTLGFARNTQDSVQSAMPRPGLFAVPQLPLGGNANLGLSNGLMSGAVGLGGGGRGAVSVAAVASSPVRSLVTEGIGKLDGDLSSLSPVPYVFNGGLRGRKGSAVEKVAERRQRRMIKNRESASRSRARKQAYMEELEAEVAKLKEKNQELQKKQIEMTEEQNNQVLERINQKLGSKRVCLRRTVTGPW